MTEQNQDYQRALDSTTQILSPTEGFIKSSTNIAISSIAKQNNTIIELLIGLHEKLNLIVAKQQSSNLAVAFEEINAKLKNLKIDAATKNQVIPARERVIAVWKDPKQRIAEFKKQKDEK